MKRSQSLSLVRPGNVRRTVSRTCARSASGSSPNPTSRFAADFRHVLQVSQVVAYNDSMIIKPIDPKRSATHGSPLPLRSDMAGSLLAVLSVAMLTGVAGSHAASERSLLFDSSGRFAGTYACTVKASGGVGWDGAAQEWAGSATYRPKNETVFRIRVDRSVNVADFDGRLRTAMKYTVELSDEVTPVQACTPTGSGRDLVISSAGMLKCTVGASDFQVHLGDLRFMKASWDGFWFRGDLGKYRPTMAVGDCTRF